MIAILVDRARGDGLKLTGEGGLLQQKLGQTSELVTAATTDTATAPADATATTALIDDLTAAVSG